MKTTYSLLLGTIVSFFVFTSCQRDIKELPGQAQSNEIQSKAIIPIDDEDNGILGVNSPTGPYAVTLFEFNVPVGNNYRWVWKVQNTNPGNGNNGTVQDLSHWGFAPAIGGCFGVNNIVSAAYSSNGVNWTSFTPSIQTDPSQSCYTGPVLKFDFGTSGSAPSYFRLILNRPYATGMSTGFYKSGRRTGCGTFQFLGIKCTGPIVINGGPPPFGT